ncbi:MAG: glycine cleavage system protein GcvH [Candidatus Dasytiphilus stammeri]
MSIIPNNLKYCTSHEWIQSSFEDKEHYIVGITDYAQNIIGDIVFIDLPDIDVFFKKGEECAVIESVKAASSVYMPISGKIVSINNELIKFPELVNNSPYEKGWLLKLKASNKVELELLLNANKYKISLEQDL